MYEFFKNFSLLYFNKTKSFYQYDSLSYGQDFLSLADGDWYHYGDIPGMFSKDYARIDGTAPPWDEMLRIPQGQYAE